MDPSSAEYTIVHRTLSPQPEYNLVLLQKDSKYSVLYEYVTREDRGLSDNLWYNIDGLAKHGVELLSVTYDAWIEMGKFIREYVGEARWILAVLTNT